MAKHEEFYGSKTPGALAIFCRAPRLGRVKTRLAQTHGDEFALQLYRAMLADSFELGRTLSPEINTFACFTPDDAFEGEDSLRELWGGPKLAQCEGDLGARMLDCFARLRAQGYEKIVLIGSDSPDVPLPRLKRAFEVLEVVPMMIYGPSPDGGFYLIGASLEVPEWLFEDVLWSSENMLSAIRWNNLKRMKAKLEYAQLPSWRDVDDAEDVIELRRRLFEVGTWAPHTRQFLQLNP